MKEMKRHSLHEFKITNPNCLEVAVLIDFSWELKPCTDRTDLNFSRKIIILFFLTKAKRIKAKKKN